MQVPIYSPRGPAYLAPNAARAWEAMRQASLRELGTNLYPLGPDSAYRSYQKQVERWRIFRGGGSEAAPPGTSAHGLGKAVDLASPEMRRAIDVLGRPFGWAKMRLRRSGTTSTTRADDVPRAGTAHRLHRAGPAVCPPLTSSVADPPRGYQLRGAVRPAISKFGAGGSVEQQVLAYLDPGSGSRLIQIIVGGLAAVGVRSSSTGAA
jgi:hypothetical protein